jgi:ElaB/YqjD/DUF883 family membrane-anchored ribosome-binding protein
VESAAAEFAQTLTQGFDSTQTINDATRMLLWDMRDRAEEALSRARERAEEPPAMCEGTPAGHPELWVSPIPRDRGPAGNVKLWREAEQVLDRMCSDAEDQGLEFNEGALCALTEAYNRCIEERRRA